MRDFLLDTNIWEYWFNAKGHPVEHANIQTRVKELAELGTKTESFPLKLGISVITLGEIDYGYNKKKQSREYEFRQFLSGKNPWTVFIDKHVAKMYGMLRARLFEKYAPKDKKREGLRPEQLIDPVTSLELGIQENDLWIAAQAMRKNVILVTNDKLHRICEVAGNELHIDNWAKGK